MSYEVFARKWRPQVFQDVVGQENTTQTLMNAITTDRLAHAYLFSGARGVGKTSVARILAKALNCKEGEPGIPCNVCSSCQEITTGSSVDVQEIDGASNRGIDEIRELRENIKYMPSSNQYRVYIIDEVHMLTLPAFNALLKTLEEPPAHVKFIFATTEPHKVPVTILSRCQRFDFKRIPIAQIVDQLKKITKAEGIEISDQGLMVIARESEGSMRDAESLLDQVVSFGGDKVEDKTILNILGIIDRDLLFETAKAIVAGSAKDCIEIVNRVFNFGYDIKEFYRALMDHFRNLLVSLIAPENDLLDMTPGDVDELIRQAQLAGPEKLQQILNLLIYQEEDLRFSFHPKLVLETTMIKLCRVEDALSYDDILKKIEALEKRLSNSSTPGNRLPIGNLSDPGVEWNKASPKAERTDRPDIESNSKDWKGFLDFLATKSRALSNVLKDWQFLGFKDGVLEIGRGANSFASGYLDEPEIQEKFVGYCRDFFKGDIKVKILGEKPNNNHKRTSTASKRKNNSTKKDHTDLPQPVQDILEIFQGEIKEEISANKVRKKD